MRPRSQPIAGMSRSTRPSWPAGRPTSFTMDWGAAAWVGPTCTSRPTTVPARRNYVPICVAPASATARFNALDRRVENAHKQSASRRAIAARALPQRSGERAPRLCPQIRMGEGPLAPHPNPLPAPRGEGAHRVAVRSSSSFHAESCKLATSLLRPHAHRLEPPMQLNAFFPSLDIGSDPAKIRDWAQAAEDLGYAYIEVPDTSLARRRGTAGSRSTTRRPPFTRPL